MDSNAERAVKCFARGFNCSQAVLSAYASTLGLEVDLALKVAGGFGGGIGRRGDVCGAATGAVMVLGLKHGWTTTDDTDGRKRTYEAVNEFLRRFQQRTGAIDCRDLLGFDLSTDEGMKLAMERRIHTDVCPGFIRAAAEILEEML